MIVRSRKIESVEKDEKRSVFDESFPAGTHVVEVEVPNLPVDVDVIRDLPAFPSDPSLYPLPVVGSVLHTDVDVLSDVSGTKLDSVVRIELLLHCRFRNRLPRLLPLFGSDQIDSTSDGASEEDFSW